MMVPVHQWNAGLERAPFLTVIFTAGSPVFEGQQSVDQQDQVEATA